MKEEIKILKWLVLKSNHITQTEYFIISRMPEFLYERKGSNLLIGEDSGFYNALCEYNCKYDKAFAGRPFTINMKSGHKIEARGEWWHTVPTGVDDLIFDCAISTEENLKKCFVFYSFSGIKKHIIDDFKKNNEPIDYRDYENQLKNKAVTK